MFEGRDAEGKSQGKGCRSGNWGEGCRRDAQGEEVGEGLRGRDAGGVLRGWNARGWDAGDRDAGGILGGRGAGWMPSGRNAQQLGCRRLFQGLGCRKELGVRGAWGLGCSRGSQELGCSEGGMLRGKDAGGMLGRDTQRDAQGLGCRRGLGGRYAGEMVGVRTAQRAKMQEGCSREGCLEGGVQERGPGFGTAREIAQREGCSVVRMQEGTLEEGCLRIWMFGAQTTGACLEAEVQEQHWQVGVCAFPRCLQGFANLFTRQHLVMRNGPRWVQFFPREADLRRDTQGCSHPIGSQRTLKVRVKFRAVQIQTPYRLNLPWVGLCRCYQGIKADVGIFVTSVRFSKRFGTSTIPCCVCITGLMAEIFQLCAQPQAERM